MASLTKVRALPDLQILPAHGPVAPSSHQRVDELLGLPRAAPRPQPRRRSPTARRPASPSPHQLGWTRHEKAYDELDVFSQGMASMETKAHLELLVARGDAAREETPDGVLFAQKMA